MQLAVSTSIHANPKQVWKVITDIENSDATIGGIDKIEILEQATGPSIVGLKWRETRTMFGKPATEVMWVTDALEDSFYQTRAESHGAIYNSRLVLTPQGKGTQLTMSFEGTAVTLGSKIVWALTGWMAKGAMRKVLAQDLADIKDAAET